MVIENSNGGPSMARCSDPRDLAELDPVTFFIVTELMAADRERRRSAAENESGNALFEFSNAKVA